MVVNGDNKFEPNETFSVSISAAGAVTTIAGRAGSIGVLLGDLPGSLNAPVGMAIDVNGALYTTSENSVLRIRLP